MGRLTTLKPSVPTLNPRLQTHTVAEFRIGGRARQSRRMKMWTQAPHCAGCGKLTQYPYGFELDHIVPLHKGGADEEFNCQILCVSEGDKPGCHAIKTREDMKP